MAEAKDANTRVAQHAVRLGLEIDIREMDASTRTAADAAQACGCDVAQIVKSLVFRGATTATPLLFLVSGRNRVNETAVAAEIGEGLQRPDADDVRALTGFAIGGIPPFGHKSALRTFIDTDLMAYDTVWAAAGTPRSVFAVAPSTLAAAVNAEPIRVG